MNPTHELFQFDKGLLELDHLESRVLSAGGDLTTRCVPIVGSQASKKIVHDRNVNLQSFVDNMFKKNVPPPFEDTEMSSF